MGLGLLAWLGLDPAGLSLERGTNEAREERVRRRRPALELRVKLTPDEKWVIAELDELDEAPVGRGAAENEPRCGELIAVVVGKLVSMAMTFRDVRHSIGV